MGPEDHHIKRLNAFIRSVAQRPFKWGEWDCIIFTNEAFKAMYNIGWADDLLERYINDGKLLTRHQIRSEYGYQTIDDMLADRMTRVYNVPPRGSLVVGGSDIVEAGYLGSSFGIAVGSSAAFLSDTGMVYYPIDMIESAWVKNDTA